MSDARGARLHGVLLVLLMLGTSLLTGGVIEGLREEPLATQEVRASETRLEGPVTVYVDGQPMLVVDDGRIQVLGDLRVSGAPLAVEQADPDSCPEGGISIGDSETVVCHGVRGAAGAKGTGGSSVLSRLLVVSLPQAQHAECEVGGYLLMVGIDDGAGIAVADDGALHADEVGVEAVVCHGIPGQGERGPPGEVGPPGFDGGRGPQGLPGGIGADGYDMLVAFESGGGVGSVFGPCSDGGHRLFWGKDDGMPGGNARDGVLSPGEHDPAAPKYVCNGAQLGPKGDAGRAALIVTEELTEAEAADECAGADGIRVRSGVDDGSGGGTAGDGVLQLGEELPNMYVCNGTNGTDGKDGYAMLLQVVDATDNECPTGGTRFVRGLDDGIPGGIAGNKILEFEEEDQAEAQIPEQPRYDVVCNGAKGDKGDIGFSTLVRTGNATFAQCDEGGTTLHIGADDGVPGGIARDGILQSEEEDPLLTRVTCNGLPGPTGAPGSPGGVDRLWIHQVPSQWKQSIVDQTSNDVGEHSSITVGRDGLPIIAYYDGENGDAKVAHCLDLYCSLSTRTVLESTGDVGQYASIAIRSGGLPVIGYYDATKGAVKVVYCLNVNCTQRDPPTTVDDGGPLNADVGQWLMLTMPNGSPVLDYYDATNGNLKRTTCGLTSCIVPETFILVDSLGDVGKYLVSTGFEVVFYDATEREIKRVACTGVLSTDCALATVVASNVDVNSRMARLGNYVYLHEPNLRTYAYVCIGCSPVTPIVGGDDSPGQMAWAEGKPGDLGAFVEQRSDLVSSAMRITLRRCGGGTCIPSVNSIVLTGNLSYMSTTIDPWDTPLMAWHDETDGSLKFLRAPNPPMMPNYWRR